LIPTALPAIGTVNVVLSSSSNFLKHSAARKVATGNTRG
jgi:hypothetical protein